MIACFAETFSDVPGQKYDAAREELQTLVKARLSLIDLRMRLVSQSEHALHNRRLIHRSKRYRRRLTL